MERLRYDYEVLLELAVKEKENEMRNTIIENEELEDLAAQVQYYKITLLLWASRDLCLLHAVLVP